MNDAFARELRAGRRVTRDEAAGLFAEDLLELGAIADARRRLVHPEETVGFIVDRIINFTNICEAKCRFCAYHARAGVIEPYDLRLDEIIEKADALARAGGTQIMLQGGLNPEYTIESYVTMLRAVKERHPDIALHSFSPAETVHLAKRHGMPLADVIGMLKHAGLDSMPGASDLLVDRVRRSVSPRKCTVDEWRAVMDALAAHGLFSSATMTYGMGETTDELVEHLDVVRSTQERTGVIRAFIPWSFSPANTALSDVEPATGTDFLRIVAIARIYLDNVRYIQSGWLTEGLPLAQLALAMGANDMGGVLTEEVVVQATGVGTRATAEDFIALIRDAGKTPVLRNSRYEIIRRYD
ncbi:MAG TPA: CofH family radical SAM protein [Spirochaetota bacterium]|nr:CofH family radical SAM protein [Spirochaetota bacterium]HPI22922.1 CofH family radical SAM protein [Spirochaetota bacterium]HPU87327.1 CofH family radical SAM protein [Spirochaetota bacterium]